MIYRIIFTPEAADQLAELYHYIAEAAAPEIAAQYTEAIVSYCENLHMFPHRGTMRDDVRPGLRITNYKKRAVIAFHVDADLVSIIGVFYGGQNYEAILSDVTVNPAHLDRRVALRHSVGGLPTNDPAAAPLSAWPGDS